jgi:antitoxin MazE
MKVSIIRIGNSRGVRLPKAMLDQLGMGAEAELAIEGDRLTLTPSAAVARRGWTAAFAAAPAEAWTAEDEDWLEAPLAQADDL